MDHTVRYGFALGGSRGELGLDPVFGLDIELVYELSVLCMRVLTTSSGKVVIHPAEKQ